MGYELGGFDGKVAVVTGAGRMRSIGRPIALALARAGCDLVLTGSGKPASAYLEDERRAGWRNIKMGPATIASSCRHNHENSGGCASE